jgi:hypothetical protein
MSTAEPKTEPTLDAGLPTGPLGERARWMLSLLRYIAENGVDAVDFATVQPEFVPPSTGDRPIDEDWLRGAWGTAARRMGAGKVVDVEHGEHGEETKLSVLLEVDGGRRFWLSMETEPLPPHRIVRWETAPAVPGGVTIRRADPSDGPGLARLERDAPIVLGDRSMRFEHDGDYLASWALLEEPGAVVAETEHGIVAAVSSSVVPLRVGGRVYRTRYTHRVRTHPQHAGTGMLQHLTRAGLEAMPLGVAMDALVVCIGQGNEAMLKGWAGRPGQWPVSPTRCLLDTAAIADAAAASEVQRGADVDRVIACLNATHDQDEGYVPYTPATFEGRLTSAPNLYGPQSLWAFGDAVVGIWEAGRSVRTIVTTPDTESTERRGIAADWGIQPGGEDDLERLLRGISVGLSERGLTHLAVYASPPTPGWDVLQALAVTCDTFDMWTLPIMPAADAAQRGTYVDALAF